MTRECAVDYEKIKKYINDYCLSGNLSEEQYTSSLKLIHKCYFTAVTWNAELMHNKSLFLKTYKDTNDDIIYRITESVSDLGSSLFNWTNGNYKASRVMLRVAIENFVRSISSIENKDQLTEKNVYKLFDHASPQNIFSGNLIVKKCYETLHSDYKILCEDAHTAALQNMAHITSLADLPTFDENKSEETTKIFVRVARNITTMFCIIFNAFYHKMHHRNRENILNSLSRSVKPHIVAPQS